MNLFSQRPAERDCQPTSSDSDRSVFYCMLRWPKRLWAYFKVQLTKLYEQRGFVGAQRRSALRTEDPHTRTSPSRRAFLQGRLWKLKSKSAPLAPRRLPSQVSITNEAQPARRTIAGISIEAVAPTNLQLAATARTIPVFRPPGAVEESQFLAGCTRCGDCITACPYQAIRLAPATDSMIASRQRIVGTPIVDADVQACLMCEDFPCIAACQPGVLSPTNPPIMGTAFITAQLCLAYQQTPCSVCSQHCPVEDVIRVDDGKPAITQDNCTGCGVCRQVCPAPENAILLMPALSRLPLKI